MRADDADELLRRAAAGNRECLDQLLERDGERMELTLRAKKHGLMLHTMKVPS